VAVADELVQTIDKLRKQLPPEVEIRVISENASYVKSSLNAVKHTIVEGGLLTILIVFLFLHSWRSTIITGVTLPISVLSTFIAMYAFGFTINAVTLMALSLCIGLLIDDAIVVRENIVRHVGMGKSHLDAARDGTEEIGLAVLATTLAICAVFIPVAFMSGIIGRIFFPVWHHRHCGGTGVPVCQLHAGPDVVLGLERPGGNPFCQVAVAGPDHGRCRAPRRLAAPGVWALAQPLPATAQDDAGHWRGWSLSAVWAWCHWWAVSSCPKPTRGCFL
jgi:hypothetical protein